MSEPVSGQQLLAWAESLAAVARTGLAFTQSLYERERYEEILGVAAEMRAVSHHDVQPGTIAHEWLESVVAGVPGYVTPKIAVGAVVGNDQGEVLLVQRSDSGVWLYPTGWADVGYSAAEVAQKEVFEETGIWCEPVRLLSVLDGLRLGFTHIPLYSLVFYCRAVGGELNGHPLETSAVGWFGPENLPQPIASAERWAAEAFAAIRGDEVVPSFDLPRRRPWESPAH